jgi:hypothetical protein
MPDVVFQLVGGPWDGQTLATNSADEANACFAQALYAISGGRCGACIPLVAPAGKPKSNHHKAPLSTPPSHEYRIDRSEASDGRLLVVARHLGNNS